MSWEPDTEELRLGIARKEINDLKSQTSFSANPISVGSSSNAMGSNSGTASMNQGSNGDVVKDLTNAITTVSENSISWIVGAIDAVGSLFTVKPDPATTGTIEPTADCATIRTLSGGVDGQKITLKPEKNKKICLMHNPVTNTSAIGNLLLGGVDVTITDPEMITLRFTTEVGSLYKDSYLNNVLPIIPTPASPQTPPPVLLIPKGGWIIESIGEGNTIVGSNRVVKDPVKVTHIGNNITHPKYNSPIDGIAMTVGDRFLVKDQTNTVDNGIYIWADGASLINSTRSTDMASGSTQKEGTMTYIQDGTEAEKLYAINIGGNTIVMGTSANTWEEIGNAGANQTLSNLTSPTSVNQDLVMQNGFAITNVDGVYFNTRITTPAIPAITYDGTDIFAKGSGAEVNLTSTTNNWSDITIDVNKDMNNKQLTNLNAVVSTSNVTATGFIFNTSSGNPSKITSSATSDIMGFMVDGVEKGSFAKDGTLDTIFEVAGNPSPMMKFSSTATGSNRVVGTIQFDGLDLTPSRQTYGLIYGWSRDVGASSKEGELQFNVMKSNVSTGIMKMDGTGLLPYADNSSVLGSASLGWSEIRSKGNIYGSTYNFVTSSGNPSKITSDSDSEGIGFQINGAEKVKFFLDGFGDTEIEIKGTINPVMKFYSTATGADRVVGGIYFDGLDSASSQETYALIYGRSRNASSTAKEGEIQFNVMKSNSSTPIMKMDGTGLLPHTDDTFTLGSPSLGWSEIRSTGNIYGKEYKFVTTSGTAPSGNGIIYFDGTDIWAKTGSGSKSLSNIGSGGASGANLTLSNLSSPIAINQTLLPNISGGVIYSLGSGSAKWRNIFTEKLGFGITAMTMPTTTGTNGQVLTTDGSSTLSWSTAGATGATIELDNLGTTSLNASLNMNTNLITFDADADTSIYSSTDNELLSKKKIRKTIW